jgi:hypothetical protein
MVLDPNVQVAFVSVFATLITTLGVIAVAVINNRKERAKAADAGVEAGLDEGDVLKRMLALIAENERKETTISHLRLENQGLEDENRMLRAENTRLRLEKRGSDGPHA